MESKDQTLSNAFDDDFNAETVEVVYDRCETCRGRGKSYLSVECLDCAGVGMIVYEVE